MLAIKPRLADLFEPASHKHLGQRQAALNRIACKHVDFLLIDHQGRPLLGIELDDKSHARKDRQQRDRFVDKIFQNASLPILHIPAKKTYDRQELEKIIREKHRT